MAALIAFFSGTGGAKLAAELLAEEFERVGEPVKLLSLDPVEIVRREDELPELLTADRLIILFAVHALDAPEPVYQFLAKLPEGNRREAAVISVSGAGEIWPNTSCRRGASAKLKRAGWIVFYEEMLVMPTNFLIRTPEPAGTRVVQRAPQICRRIAGEILAGVKRRSPLDLTTAALPVIARFERIGARLAGETFTAGSACTACGWCSRNCPTANISMSSGRPQFGKQCMLCMRCLSGCPADAISIPSMNMLKIPGFSISSYEQGDPQSDISDTDAAPGVLWLGVKKYLLQNPKR